MRNDKKNDEKKFGLNKFSKILGILYIVVLLALEGLLIAVDILPMLYICAIMIFLTLISFLILPTLLFKKAKRKRKITCLVIAIVLLLLYAVGIVYVADTMGFFAKVFSKNDVVAKDVSVSEKPFNVFISGNDNFGEIEDEARSDVNMVMSVNPKTKKILLTSIPRDYYVYFPGKGANDKLTHSGIYGIQETISTVENLLNTEINYYVKVDFDAVTSLVDAIGGITVNSDYEFSTSGRQNNGYYFQKGENELNGAEALAFCRERHAFSDGDFQRGRNQQLVLEATIKKCTSSSVILTKYGSILSAIGDYMQTNMSSDNLRELVKMQVSEMPNWNIEKVALKGTPDSAIGYSIPDTYVSVVMPDQTSVEEIKQKIANLMAGKETEPSSGNGNSEESSDSSDSSSSDE